MLTLTAVIHRDEDMYVAECSEVGTASQGKTIEESKERSFITTFEVTEVAETQRHLRRSLSKSCAIVLDC